MQLYNVTGGNTPHLCKRIFTLVLVVFVSMLTPVVSFAGGSDADGIPSGRSPNPSAEEFRRQLGENEGGVITLTGDIVWDDYEHGIMIKQPTTVMMGDYGIHIPEDASFRVEGSLRFVGNGAAQPLFYIEGGFSVKWAEIVANGDGATAIYAAKDEFSLDCISVTARGQNSTAIHATGSVELFQCEVMADAAAVVSDVNKIKIDGCRVAPMPQNATTIQRQAVPGRRIQENGICVAVGGSLDALGNREADYYLLDAERRVSAHGYSFPASWENLPTDTSTPGEYTILCRPVGVPDWFPVEGMTAYQVPLHIVAENQPHIESAARFGWDMAMLRFFSEILDYDELTLWYSTDDEKTWVDFEADGNSVSSFGASAETLEANKVYLFRLEVTGGPMAGFSNTLEFPYYDGDPDADGGGDRNGPDRFPNKPGTSAKNNSVSNLDDETQTESNPDNNQGDETQTDNDQNDAAATDFAGTSGNLPNGSISDDTSGSLGAGITRDHTRLDLAPHNAGNRADSSAGNSTDNNATPVLSNLTTLDSGDSQKEPTSGTLPVAIKEQPPLSHPSFPTAAAALLAGSAAVLMAGAAVWIRIRKLGRR